MKKLICPHCGANLRKVGISNVQTGLVFFDATIKKGKDFLVYKQDRFNPDDQVNDFLCGECEEILNLKRLGIEA